MPNLPMLKSTYAGVLFKWSIGIFKSSWWWNPWAFVDESRFFND